MGARIALNASPLPVVVTAQKPSDVPACWRFWRDAAADSMRLLGPLRGNTGGHWQVGGIAGVALWPIDTASERDTNKAVQGQMTAANALLCFLRLGPPQGEMMSF